MYRGLLINERFNVAKNFRRLDTRNSLNNVDIESLMYDAEGLIDYVPGTVVNMFNNTSEFLKDVVNAFGVYVTTINTGKLYKNYKLSKDVYVAKIERNIEHIDTQILNKVEVNIIDGYIGDFYEDYITINSFFEEVLKTQETNVNLINEVLTTLIKDLEKGILPETNLKDIFKDIDEFTKNIKNRYNKMFNIGHRKDIRTIFELYETPVKLIELFEDKYNKEIEEVKSDYLIDIDKVVEKIYKKISHLPDLVREAEIDKKYVSTLSNTINIAANYITVISNIYYLRMQFLGILTNSAEKLARVI